MNKEDEMILTFLKGREVKVRKKLAAIINELKKNSRMSLTEISRNTGIPVSTIHDYMTHIKEFYSFNIKRKEVKNGK